MATTTDPLTVLDLFAGSGGMGTGFRDHFEVTAAVELDIDAAATYRTNHTDTDVYQKDIAGMDFGRQDFQGITGVIGGPPCQDFSQLNKHADASSARADLITEMVRVAEQIKPNFVVIENVAKIPDARTHAVARDMEALGYTVNHKRIRSYDYGSVQLRPRWMMVAVKGRSVFPEPLNTKRTAAEILLPDTIPQVKMSKSVRSFVQTLPSGKWVDRNGTTKGFCNYNVIDPAKPMPAVVNPTKLRFIRPDRSEYLSFEELAAAQGYPVGYEFVGTSQKMANGRSRSTNESIGQQLANSVPVEMANTFAAAIAGALTPAASKPKPDLLYDF
jgi:site-specific DNA-cytosine methylase